MIAGILLCISLTAPANNLVLVADYPHLMHPIHSEMASSIKWLKKSSSKVSRTEFLNRNNRDLDRLMLSLKEKHSTISRAHKYSKSDPPPTNEALRRLAYSVGRAVDFFTNEVRHPLDIDTLSIELIIFVEWRGGWCDTNFIQAENGTWRAQVPEDEINSMFRRIVPLAHEKNITVRAERQALEQSIAARIRYRQPLWRPWTAGFIDPNSRQIATRSRHSELLASWWRHQIPSLRARLNQVIVRQSSVPIRIRVLPYDSKIARNQQLERLPNDNIFWLSRSQFKPTLGGKIVDSSYKKRTRHYKVQQKREFINNNPGSWSLSEQKSFCVASQSIQTLAPLFSSGNVLEINQSPFPESIIPASNLADLQTIWKDAPQSVLSKDPN